MGNESGKSKKDKAVALVHKLAQELADNFAKHWKEGVDFAEEKAKRNAKAKPSTLIPKNTKHKPPELNKDGSAKKRAN